MQTLALATCQRGAYDLPAATQAPTPGQSQSGSSPDRACQLTRVLGARQMHASRPGQQVLPAPSGARTRLPGLRPDTLAGCCASPQGQHTSHPPTAPTRQRRVGRFTRSTPHATACSTRAPTTGKRLPACAPRAPLQSPTTPSQTAGHLPAHVTTNHASTTCKLQHASRHKPTHPVRKTTAKTT